MTYGGDKGWLGVSIYKKSRERVRGREGEREREKGKGKGILFKKSKIENFNLYM